MGGTSVIRDYEPGDEAAVRAIHEAQGIDYAFPDLASPLFFVKKVRVVDGKVVAALMLRMTAETYLFVQGDPRDKMAAMATLQPEVLRQAWQLGIDDVVCFVPDTLLTRFRKRLGQLGWNKDREGWTSFSRGTTE